MEKLLCLLTEDIQQKMQMVSPFPPVSLPEGKINLLTLKLARVMSSARSIDSTVNFIDAVLNDPNVCESTQGAEGRSGAAEDNCIHPSVKDIIDKQNVIIDDLYAKVALVLSYVGLQDMPVTATSMQQRSGGGGHSPLVYTAICLAMHRRLLFRTAVGRSFADMVKAVILSIKSGSTGPQAESSSSAAGGWSSTILNTIPSKLIRN